MNRLRFAFLAVSRLAYERAARPILFRMTPDQAHHRTLRLLAWLDSSPLICSLFRRIHTLAFDACEVEVGGVRLAHPLIMAAGLVKGEGFATETDALAVVDSGRNIMPGWRSLPSLVGLVEFGSFTRYPRLGNAGTAMWRDVQTRSTQNRVGLRNPGAVAAAAFLAKRRFGLPEQFGINLAVTPGVDDIEQQQSDVLEAASAFFDQAIHPTWVTLNLSCPNTEDDPTGRQTEIQTRQLCGALLDLIRGRNLSMPLWVKISPALAAEQYRILMRVFHEVGVGAVIATNTFGRPAPDNEQQIAGVGGGCLHPYALDAVRTLATEKTRLNARVDVIGCGGVLDGRTYQDFIDGGVAALQYWSALVYRGPLAAAVIQHEWKHGR